MAVRITETMLKKNQRKCRTCKLTKGIKHFVKELKPGLKWMPSDCLECERKRQKARWKMKSEDITRPRPDHCEVCKVQRCNGKRGRKRIRICCDHCHVSNLFRGWICDDCNHILGLAKDSPRRLHQLATYLRKFYHSEAVLRLIRP